MIDAQLPLQAAIVAAIKSDATLQGLWADRFFDRVPTTPGQPFPYGNLRGMDSVDAGADCVPGVEVFVDLDGWSRAVGSVEAKKIMAALVRLLDAPLDVAGFETQAHEVRRARTLPDGALTTRADVQLRYLLAPRSA